MNAPLRIYQNVSCSQCGRDFGPGSHGFSHCENHEHRLPVSSGLERIADILREADAELALSNLHDDLRQARRAERIAVAELNGAQARYLKATDAWTTTHTADAYAAFTSARTAWRAADTAYERTRVAVMSASHAFRSAGGKEVPHGPAWSDIDVVGQLGGQLRD